jgi:hypothetical protein
VGGELVSQPGDKFREKCVGELRLAGRQDIADGLGALASKLARRPVGSIAHLPGSLDDQFARLLGDVGIIVEGARDRRSG